MTPKEIAISLVQFWELGPGATEMIEHSIREAVKAEREECAKICERIYKVQKEWSEDPKCDTVRYAQEKSDTAHFLMWEIKNRSEGEVGE